MPGRSHGANGQDCAAQACGAVSVRASDQQECRWMCRGSVPGGPGWRIHPCGRDTWRTIRNPGDREPREPCPDGQRWNPWDAPTVRREEIGRAHVCTPVTNAHIVCSLLLEKKTTH